MSDHPVRWRSSLAFIFVASAAAIGLGNIWRFPYLAGENGGSAFVLVYMLCVALLAIPLLLIEVFLGREGRSNPVTALARVARSVKRSHHWGIVGGMGIWASFFILSYYVVVAGWVLSYFIQALSGQFSVVTEASSLVKFQQLQHDHWQMLIMDTVLMFITVMVILAGVKRGLERTVLAMFPALFLLIFVLLIQAVLSGHFYQGFSFLFKPNFHLINAKVVLLALGQAFFSLNIAMGVNIAFSAYLPEDTSPLKSVIIISIADTLVAILAGLIIFPIVFANGLSPGEGPSLIFKTLPLAFSRMPFSNVIGALFFLMLLFAAFTSMIALLEMPVVWLIENHALNRTKATVLVGIVAWLLSLVTIGSFSHGSQFMVFGMSFFSAVDFLTAGILLPVGGFLLAIFAGWFLPDQWVAVNLNWDPDGFWFRIWRLLSRYVVPIFIFLILLGSMGII